MIPFRILRITEFPFLFQLLSEQKKQTECAIHLEKAGQGNLQLCFEYKGRLSVFVVPLELCLGSRQLLGQSSCHMVNDSGMLPLPNLITSK